jgi:hypothetical protein
MEALVQVDSAAWATGILLAVGNVLAEKLRAENWDEQKITGFVESVLEATPARFRQEIEGALYVADQA